MARKLRVLLIDDLREPPDRLDSDFIELVKVRDRPALQPGAPSRPRYALGEWRDHVRMWATGEFPLEDPDILLIDSNFVRDVTDPGIAPATTDAEALERHEPHGLLHGVVYVARMFGRAVDRPFGFECYSQSFGVFADHPWARTLLGFLLAMAERQGGLSVDRSIVGHAQRADAEAACRAHFTTHEYKGYETAWKPALSMYRRSLKSLISSSEGRLLGDQAAWDACLAALNTCRRDGAYRALRRDLALRWFDARGGSAMYADEVLLYALFADHLEYDAWTEAANREALAWLSECCVLNDPLVNLVLWVEECLLESDQRPQDEVDKGWPNRVGAGVRQQQARRWKVPHGAGKMYQVAAASWDWCIAPRTMRHHGPDVHLANMCIDAAQVNAFLRENGLEERQGWSEYVKRLTCAKGAEWPFPKLTWVRDALVQLQIRRLRKSGVSIVASRFEFRVSADELVRHLELANYIATREIAG